MISILDYMIKKFVFIIKIAIYSVCKLINDNTCMCIWKIKECLWLTVCLQQAPSSFNIHLRTHALKVIKHAH